MTSFRFLAGRKYYVPRQWPAQEQVGGGLVPPPPEHEAAALLYVWLV